jgi:hypothetical protein
MKVGGRFDVGARESGHGHLAGDRCSDDTGTGRNCVVAQAIVSSAAAPRTKQSCESSLLPVELACHRYADRELG